MDIERAAVGSVSLYLASARDLDPDLLLTAMAMVSQAEVLLGEVRRRDSRSEGATVDRAVGVIIAQRGCGVQEAYDVLGEVARRPVAVEARAGGGWMHGEVALELREDPGVIEPQRRDVER